MAVRQRDKRETVGQTIRKKLFMSMVPAAVGAVGGYYYGVSELDPALSTSSTLPAMYGCMGAIVGVLGVRIFALFKEMISDFFDKPS
ncbi:MAG: hypothetical protein RMA76_14105 [Deltaproteobacteria bacterium]|jgi:uncharacterized membrane protein YedE/YeeE